jgi:hypothetical protein
MEAMGAHLMTLSVTDGTRRAYATAWHCWGDFAAQFALDPYLQTQPAGYTPAESWMSFQQAAVLAFIAYAFTERGLRATTISGYLSGVAYTLNCRGIDTSCFSSVSVLMAKSGISLLDRQREAQSERSHLPFTLDMIHHYKERVGNRDFRNHGIYTAMMVAYTLLLRISEYTRTKANHFLRTQDVGFTTALRVVPSHMCHSIEWSAVTGVVFTVRSAKNDIEGVGHRMAFTRKTSGNDCICEIAWAWARRARSSVNQPFMSMWSEKWVLSPDQLALALQSVAARMGFPRRRFAPHSLRYGGASALAAAGAPSHVIQTVGRWKSLAFLQYLKLSRSILDSVHRAITDPTVLTSKDVAALHSGAAW